jgi:hypothetical protein
MSSRTITAIRNNLVAWLALFVALGGTSLAASHYAITSTKQINPKVLNALKGKTGVAGPQGPAGANGAAGANGGAGATGAKGEPGAKGETGPAGPGAAWALVNSDGTILEQSGGISVPTHGAGGDDFLAFPSSVEGHDIIVSLSGKNGGSGPSSGVPVAGPCGPPDGSSCAGTNPAYDDGTHVHVYVGGAGAVGTFAYYITVLH